eukprot:GILJ01003597.1.p1 GENE.GILJ01003597.1~~GILJ01003597.1.p1  ORF type:complete len:132 (-),score=13.07 GILJ01003597.1:240-593(-)
MASLTSLFLRPFSASAAVPSVPKHFVLLYSFVENMIEKRTPYRAAHLALVHDMEAKGALVAGGAFMEPTDGGMLLFKAEDRHRIEAFVKSDPYYQNGLVTKYEIKKYMLVSGTAKNV